MGGVLILIGLFSGILLWGDLSNILHLVFTFILLLLLVYLGAYDDYKKIKLKNSSGISFKI